MLLSAQSKAEENGITPSNNFDEIKQSPSSSEATMAGVMKIPMRKR